MKPFNLNLWVLICILFMAFGCGSESGSGSASGKKAVSTTKGARGVGLLTNKTPGGPPQNIKIAPPAESDDDVILPPATPGGKGITRGEIEAMKAKEAKVVESDDDVILPPIKPGDKGITRGEVKAMRSAAPERGAGGPPPLP